MRRRLRQLPAVSFRDCSDGEARPIRVDPRPRGTITPAHWNLTVRRQSAAHRGCRKAKAGRVPGFLGFPMRTERLGSNTGAHPGTWAVLAARKFDG